MDLAELGAFLFQPRPDDLLRIEGRDWYDSASDDPHFARFKACQPTLVDENWQAWLNRIADTTAAGMVWRRVHALISGQPLNDYLLFEFGEQYTRNAAAGEQIRILEVPADTPPPPDFFVADHGERVAISTYDAAAKFVRSDVAGRDASYWADVAADLWEQATPFEQWWANYQHRKAA